MPNHVHLILVPEHVDALRAALLRAGEEALRRSESTGRPLGSSPFLDRVEAILGRDPKPARRGPKPRALSALSP